MFVEAEGFEPWISPCKGDMLAIYITAPIFVTFILYYKYSQNPNTNDKKNKTQVSILSLLRLILEYMLCLTWIVFICTQ